MYKEIAKLEHKVGDRLFHFICDKDAPIGEVKEALFKFLGFASQVEKTGEEAQAQAAVSQASAEDPPSAKEV